MTPPRTSPKKKSSAAGPGRRVLRAVGRWTRRLVVLCLALAAVGAATAVAAYLYFDRDLPSVEQLKQYRPPQVTKVFCADGKVCAEFYRERRTWVDVRTLPPHVKNAFIAAEDADFYQHEGLDYLGMVRAAVRALQTGKMTGASTITQQACRNLLLTRERKLSRKIREWILTPRMEKALTKDEILNLYLNQIYFGHSRYGIEEAALFYFGKGAKDLTIPEAAVLGGTPQIPHLINPLTNIVRAKRRQQYVLRQLGERGLLPMEVVRAELDKPIVLAPRPPPQVGPYYVEEVRRALVARYGDLAVLEGGMRVEIAMLPELQAAADEAVQRGLEAVDRRMGYQGPLAKLDPARFAALRPHLVTRLEEAGRRKDEVLVADLWRLVALANQQPAAEQQHLELAALEQTLEEEARLRAAEPLAERPSEEAKVAREVSVRPMREGMRAVGFVSKVDDSGKHAEVDLVGKVARIAFSQVGWARPRAVGKGTAAPKKMSEVLAVGDLVRIRIIRVGKPEAPLEATLDQVPGVQGGLVVIDPLTRQVVAMTGGYDFELSSFNRATQARRQPGSAFKPFVFAAALDSRRYTPISILNDAPEAIRDPWTGKVWKPKNFENGFDGPMTLRAGLTRSKNTLSVRLIEALTPEVVIDFARRSGIGSPLPENLTLALGTGEVSLLELTNGYATLHSWGRRAPALTVLKVTDAQGQVLQWHEAEFEEALPAATAWLTTSLMQSVVEEGTAVAVRELGRPAAGKTGTSNEYKDAWFAGYTQDLVAAAWVGFDNAQSMGRGETGGRAALPIWMGFMRAAHRDLPVRDFEVPEGIEFVRIDPLTGLLAGNAVPGRLEPFLEGTAPTALAPSPETVRPEDFFLQDVRGGGW